MAKIFISKEKCINCKVCIPSCAYNMIKLSNQELTIGEGCTFCGSCISACKYGAITITGEEGASQKKNTSHYNGVMVFGEYSDGRFSGAVQEILGEARKIAHKLGVQVSAAVLGVGVTDYAGELIAGGADKVYLVDHPLLEKFNDDVYTDVITQIVKTYMPEIFIIASTIHGSSLAARVASRLGTGLTADCTGLEVDTESRLLRQTRPTFGGNLMATIICPEARPQMCTVKPRVMQKLTPDYSRTGEIITPQVHIRESSRLRIIERIVSPGVNCNLEEAEIIVSVGRGLQNPNNLNMIKEFANVLGASIGASRALVDMGWLEYSHQVGQTGKTVRPKIYFACGISGAIQHLAGMLSSDFIVAINKDPDAPIFKAANVGIVGDLTSIIPTLTLELKRLLKK